MLPINGFLDSKKRLPLQTSQSKGNCADYAGLPVRGTDPPPVCYSAGDLQRMLYLNSPQDVLELCQKAGLATDNTMDVYIPRVRTTCL